MVLRGGDHYRKGLELGEKGTRSGRLTPPPPPPIVDDSYRYSWPVTTIQRLYTLHYLLTPIKTRLKQALRMQGPCGLEEFNFQSYSPSNDDDGLKLTVY